MPIPISAPIVVAPSPTPFKTDDSIDFAAIEHNTSRWCETPLSGFVLNSENGEESFLSESEKLEIVRAVNRARDGKKFIVGGIDSPSVAETLRKGEQLVEAGAELLRVRIPRLAGNVRDYFEQVIPRAAAPIVIIHQMAPGTFLNSGTSPGASAELIGELVSHDNVFAYITSDNLRFEARVRLYVPQEKNFWTANGSILLTGGVAGANGACLMLGNVFPAECVQVLQLISDGNWQAAKELQFRLVEADWQILSRGAAGLKAALNHLGFQAGVPRSPQPACDELATRQIQKAIDLVRGG